MTKERQETTPARAWERKWVEKRASSVLNGAFRRRCNSDLRERERKKREGETGSVSGKRRTAVTRTHRSLEGINSSLNSIGACNERKLPVFYRYQPTASYLLRSQRDTRNFRGKTVRNIPSSLVQSNYMILIKIFWKLK